jgi:signal peptidase I
MLQWALAGGLAVASYFVASRFVFQAIRVDGISMWPTLANSQIYFLKRWAYLFRDPRRSDVVVLRDPVESSLAVKRIIATSGEWVCLKAGRVYVNGRPLIEPYLPAGTATFSYSKCGDQAFKCGEGEYFVLGDNRRNSADSRVYGPIRRQSILGLISP